MNREAYETVRRVVGHRIATHRAALRAYADLGRPERLAPMAVRTEARIAECIAFLADIEQAYAGSQWATRLGDDARPDTETRDKGA
jgi:hypothetical protein